VVYLWQTTLLKFFLFPLEHLYYTRDFTFCQVFISGIFFRGRISSPLEQLYYSRNFTQSQVFEKNFFPARGKIACENQRRQKILCPQLLTFLSYIRILQLVAIGFLVGVAPACRRWNIHPIQPGCG
jgi:hypothetical protein